MIHLSVFLIPLESWVIDVIYKTEQSVNTVSNVINLSTYLCILYGSNVFNNMFTSFQEEKNLI